MNIDDYFSKLDSDLEKQFSKYGIDMSGTFGSAPAADKGKDDSRICPVCGNRLEEGFSFCPVCGADVVESKSGPTAVDLDEEEDDEDWDEDEIVLDDDGRPVESAVGIVWTDTAILANKYGCKRDDVISLLDRQFLSDSDDTWYVLDMAVHQKELGEATWMDYSDVLQSFIQEHGIEQGPMLSLFIIGGNDVIPQPAERNPSGGGDEYSDTVYADFYYCFYGPLQLDFLDFNNARCNVARLPLEMGTMHSDLMEDLGAYFRRRNEAVEGQGGVSVGRAVMTSNQDWIPASREMSRNLPTEHLANTESVSLDNMYLSPDVLEDMDDELAERYYSSIGDADMLVFNLHGSCMPEDSGFYSSGLAFSIDMLDRTEAAIFNTVACWGGRYIKYARKDSMLLNALYNNNVLLYCGSCVPALGKCGNFNWDSTWRIQPAAYSESFMARFSEYQCIGTMRSGAAFLKAKCDYYNTSRMVEDDDCILATVLMFNLYGDPSLRTFADKDRLAQIQGADGSKMTDRGCRMPFRDMNRRVVLKGKAAGGAESKSLLSDVRYCVDSNLRKIHEEMTRNLYDLLGVEPGELYSVEQYTVNDTMGKTRKGYFYNYRRQTGPVSSMIRAKVSEDGKLLDAIQTK